MKFVLSLCVLFAAIFLGFILWKTISERRILKIWDKMEDSATTTFGDTYSPEMVKHLPANVQRYFNFCILPGTSLKTKAIIHMNGQLALGPKSDPGYMPMSATQLLSFPVGFIWNVKTGNKPVRISGSDGLAFDKSWSRFWVAGMFPAVRANGDKVDHQDHYKSAFGRFVSESAFLTPAVFLDPQYASWEDISDDKISLRVDYRGFAQKVQFTLDDRGAPIKVEFPRWSDANDGNVYQLQPFGGKLSEYKTFQGFRLPTKIEAGNFFGTKAYFPFFITKISNIEFID